MTAHTATKLVRADIHRPSAIDPADYVYVGLEYIKIECLGDAKYLEYLRKIIADHMAKTGGTYSDHAHGGNCMVCGNANAAYTILFHHPKTNTYVRMGADCADKCEVSYSIGDFNAFKKNIGDARRNMAGKKKAQKLLADRGLEAAWNIYESEGDYSKPREILISIVGKLVRYGDASEAQYNLLARLVPQITNEAAIKAEREAKRKAEQEAAAPCPTGRILVEGVVLATKQVESGYDFVTKMLVQHASGWKVWGTKPAFEVVSRGDRVSFKAKVEPSKDDPKFGFYSRPTGLKVIEAEKKDEA